MSELSSVTEAEMAPRWVGGTWGENGRIGSEARRILLGRDIGSLVICCHFKFVGAGGEEGSSRSRIRPIAYQPHSSNCISAVRHVSLIRLRVQSHRLLIELINLSLRLRFQLSPFLRPIMSFSKSPVPVPAAGAAGGLARGGKKTVQQTQFAKLAKALSRFG